MFPLGVISKIIGDRYVDFIGCVDPVGFGDAWILLVTDERVGRHVRVGEYDTTKEAREAFDKYVNEINM